MRDYWSLNFRGKHYLRVDDLSIGEFKAVLELARRLKIEYHAGIPHPILRDKVLAMLFEKPSTRTRVSFESGMAQLGGHPMYLSFDTMQVKRGETIADTARIISSYSDIICARLYKQTTLEEIAKYSRVPVINALTDVEHPCQALADVMTIQEHIGFDGKTVAYVGDAANNVAHSLMIACAKVGLNYRAVCPKGYEPKEWAIKTFEKNAKKTGATLEVIEDPKKGVKGVDVVYTDVWVSMGDEAEAKKREQTFRKYQVNQELMREAGDALFMHCLPAHRGYEVTDDVIDGQNSIVFDQGENRLHTQKALMCFLLAH